MLAQAAQTALARSMQWLHELLLQNGQNSAEAGQEAVLLSVEVHLVNGSLCPIPTLKTIKHQIVEMVQQVLRKERKNLTCQEIFNFA